MSHIKVFKEDGHYFIRIVDRLPRRGNAQIFYMLRGDSIDRFYRWNTFESEFETISVISENIQASTLNLSGLKVFANDTEAFNGGLVAGDIYRTSSGELRVKL